ncbi:hypothetical protein [Marinagarivorans algicola]|uniref:hypothetical protein n=1 Tax=Marinagarivorans algicola TaxID=1513270 RepID=UPI0037365B7A
MATTNEPDFPSLAIPTQDSTASTSTHISSHNKQAPAHKALLKPIILGGSLCITLGLLVLTFNKLYITHSNSTITQFNLSRNYALTPFDEIDAQKICQLKTESVHGSQLVMSYLDSHSSRFETRTGMYKMFLVAHIGTLDDYEEARVHCHVNPKQHQVRHYKTVFPRRASLMSRAFQFFTKPS